MHQYYFEKLNVWQEAVELTVFVYGVTKQLPAEEKYNLSSQLKRAALSISSNIAEGSTRKSSVDYSRFINIAYGSSIEVLNHILIGKRLGFFDDVTVNDARQPVTKITNQLRALNQSVNPQSQKNETTQEQS